jgi:hypothetical protein
MLLIGSRHRRDSCSEAYRFARSGSVPADPKVDLDVPDSSLGVHRSPLRRHDGRCVHFPPGPSPRLRLGTATSRACSALAVPPGSSGFLRSRLDPKIQPFDCPRVCCTPQPAMGFTTFRIPCAVSRPCSDPKVVDLAVHPGIVPCGEYPSKRSPLRQHFDHAVTAMHPFGCDRVHRLVCLLAVPSLACVRVATVRGPCSPTSRLCSAGESVASRATLPRRARSMLPWALDRLVPMLPRVSRSPSVLAGRFAWRPEPLRRPSTRTSREGMGVSALSGSCDPKPRPAPKGGRVGRVGSGVSRRIRLGRIPPRAPKDWWNASGTAPRGGPPRRARTRRCQRPTSSRRIPEGTRSRPGADSEEWRPVVRARARHPSAVARVPDGGTARRTRAAPEGACVCAPLARPLRERAASNPAAHIPKDGVARRAVGVTRRCVPWRLVAPASPASWSAGSGQTVIVFTGTAETRSEDEVSPPIRRSE